MTDSEKRRFLAQEFAWIESLRDNPIPFTDHWDYLRLVGRAQ